MMPIDVLDKNGSAARRLKLAGQSLERLEDYVTRAGG
jgi:hypothetical protein